MRSISRLLLVVVLMFGASTAGAVSREVGEPGPGKSRPRLIRVVKKIVKSLGDLLSDPKP